MNKIKEELLQAMLDGLNAKLYEIRKAYTELHENNIITHTECETLINAVWTEYGRACNMLDDYLKE